MASQAPILIIGAGIGGLTAAIALRQAGLEVVVYERAPVLGEVGAGLGLLSNAVRVLDSLGLGETIRRQAHPLVTGSFLTASGRVLQSIRFDKLLPPGAPPNFVVHRADLHRWLLSALPENFVRTGHHCVSIAEKNGSVHATFANGHQAEGHVLVGADGVRSIVRQHLWGERPFRYGGQTCYRGVASFTPRDPAALNEIHGRGQRASCIFLGGGRTYWWAALNAPAGEQDDPATRRDHLLAAYPGWPSDVPEAIAATPPGTILRNDLTDLPPLRRWSQGRVTLLGDAAHPMTPNLGQGACSSIEDAIVLARHLRRHRQSVGPSADPSPALLAYERERLPRTTMLVNHSWQFGIPCRLRHPWAVALRDNLLAAAPRPLLARRFRGYIGFDAGTLEK